MEPYVQDRVKSELKAQCHEIFASDFFHNSSSLKPLKITLGSFQIFRKFLDIFAGQGAPLVSTIFPSVLTTPLANNGNNIRLLTLETKI